MMSSSLHKYSLISWVWEWKERQSKKEPISLFPRENSLLKGENTGRNSLHLLFISINGLFNQDLCLGIRLLRDKWYEVCLFNSSMLIINLMIWSDESDNPQKWNLLYNFLRWRWIRIKPEIASIPTIGEVWKGLDIHNAALHCIFLSTLRE